MSDKRVSLGSRLMISSISIGVAITIISAIPYNVPDQRLPSYVADILEVISIAFMPGHILSAFCSNSAHNPNLILAVVINSVLYGTLAVWLLSRLSRRRSVA